MSALTITYIIGTESIGVGGDEVSGVEAYQIEVEEQLRAAFPSANHIDVAIKNGYDQVRIEGVDDLDEEEAMISRIRHIADGVWNHGEWHDQ